MDECKLKKYADLAVYKGVNVQKGQLVVISCPVENFIFGRLVQKSAYEAGASNVIINWEDYEVSREFYLNASDFWIENYPSLFHHGFEEYDLKGACYIAIISEYPNAFENVDLERISLFSKKSYEKLESHIAKKRSYELRWSILAVPSKEWATKVFPNLNEEKALKSLWDVILKGARADGENPLEDWENHGRNFEFYEILLNDSNFEYLYFKNNIGTDLKVGMPKNYLFIGGVVKDKNGISFFPNIPTEEIFSAPHKEKVNGKLVASKPLNYKGSIIEDFYLVFKDGKIIDFDARMGKEFLKSIIDTDEGTRYLGEIALVSNKSPLAMSNILFYNTLFDENTSCHIGIGNANLNNLLGGVNLSDEEIKEAGLNKSSVLINITFGTEDLEVIGIKYSGEEVALMRNGDFILGDIIKSE